MTAGWYGDAASPASRAPRSRRPRPGVAERDGRPASRGRRYGSGRARPSLLLPTWSIVPSRFWKAQVPYLARHYRVVTFDGRGSGRLRPAAGRGGLRQRGVRRRRPRGPGRRRGRPRRPGRRCPAASTWAVHVAAGHPERVRGPVRDRPVLRVRPPGRARATSYVWSTGHAATARGLGEVQPALLAGGRLRRTSCGSSSARCSPSRTPPSRSRTAVEWAAGPDPETLVDDRRPAGSGCDGAVCADSSRCAGRCAARSRCCTAPTTGSGRSPTASGWPS